MNKVILSILLILLPLGLNAKDAVEKPTYIGVINFPGHNGSSESPEVFIYYGFQKNKSWEVAKVDSFPKKLIWNIAFDGKLLGIVESRLISPQHRRHEVLTPEKKIKRFKNKGKPYERFESWTGYHRYRPMVVVSQGGYKDPEKWRPSSDAKAISLAKQDYIQNVKKKFRLCKDLKFVKEMSVKPKDLSFIKGYKNNKGAYIIGIRLPCSCCEGPIDVENYPHWYYIKGKSSHFIGNGLTPVDAGDFDNDGKSEWIFQYAGYNLDGYGLFTQGTKKLIKFTWSYH